jgi:hypothetical protein
MLGLPCSQINDPSMDQFKITIDRESNTISVYNNGRGIPIQMHDKEQMYIPELIFGNLSVQSLSGTLWMTTLALIRLFISV